MRPRPLPVALAIALTVTSAGCAGGSAHAPSASTTSTGSGGDSITNVQEQGVDEGGIVKMHGEHLVVLRRGRLFTVDLGGGGMRLVSIADASAPGHRPADWYDEMLIHDDTIVVIGFDYHDSATELGIFHVDGRGHLAHRATFQLRSNDYYSSRNYASRLVDGRLVLYVPHHLGGSGTSYPALREVGEAWTEIRGPAHVASPTGQHGSRVLHTVVMCDLGDDTMGCRAQGMIGGVGRSFYVSRDAVYVWIAETSHHGAQPTDAAVYRIPLDASTPGAVRAWGMPTDQLSFEEDGGALHVLVRSQGAGDGMWGGESRATELALASIPLSAFSLDAPAIDPEATYTPLPRPWSGSAMQNRFVGGYVLYGVGDSWGFWGRRAEGAVYAHPYRRGGETARISVGHGIERIEAMGRAAVVVGREGGDLSFSSIALEGGPAFVDRFVVRNASQGETRTHGFFYRDDGEDTGVLGLPIRGSNEAGWAQLRHGSAAVQFLRVRSARFAELGRLAASERGQIEDRCVASCADWYGNARPIFWRGRMFALLGYELVEGRVGGAPFSGGSGVQEIARLVLFPEEPPRRAWY